jgi:hypothetical protein
MESAEERHRRQLEKLKHNQESTTGYVPAPTKKERILESLKRQGYSYTVQSNIPMFSVKNQKEVDAIQKAVDGQTSVGFVFPAKAKLDFGTAPVDDLELLPAKNTKKQEPAKAKEKKPEPVQAEKPKIPSSPKAGQKKTSATQPAQKKAKAPIASPAAKAKSASKPAAKPEKPAVKQSGKKTAGTPEKQPSKPAKTAKTSQKTGKTSTK